jgi:hypothetical protein
MVIAAKIPSPDRASRFFAVERKIIREQNEKAIEAGKAVKRKQISQDLNKE